MKALASALVVLALAGCATTSQITKGSNEYLAPGQVSEKLKGNSFYLAIGDVDLYRHNWVGKVVPTGHTAEAAVAVQVNSSGQVQKMVTVQPTGDTPSDWLNAAAVSGGGDFAVGDLIGGLSVIDIQPHPTWLDTLDALQKATKTLSNSTVNAEARRYYRSVVVVVEPVFGPPPLSFGFGFHHHYERHARH